MLIKSKQKAKGPEGSVAYLPSQWNQKPYVLDPRGESDPTLRDKDCILGTGLCNLQPITNQS